MSEYERQNRGLAYEPPAHEVESEVRTPGDKSPEQIEREIEQTRSRLSRDIDELGNRLTPRNLKEEAKSAIKGAAQGAVSNVGEQARRTSFRLLEAIRENPLPVIAVGAGVTWLLTRHSRSDVSGSRMARYAYTGPDKNPLLVAIGAAVVGLALGLLLPGTERENQLMGPARDELVDRTEKTVERAKDAAVEAGREVKETVKAEIEEHKPEVKEVVQQAGQLKEQVKESARRVKNETKDVVKESGNNPRSGT